MKMVPLWREMRHRRGLRIVDAAARMGISKGGLSQIENGHVKASGRTLAAGCALYNCQPGDLYRAEPEGVAEAI